MWLGLALTLIASLGFGSMAVIAKLAYAAGLAPMELLQVRFTLAVPLLGLFLAIKNPRLFLIKPRSLLWAIILGGGFYYLQSATFFKAMTTMPVVTTALILYFYPVLVAILSRLILKTRTDRTSILALFLVISGCGLVLFNAFRAGLDGTGLSLAVAAVVIFSVYLVLTQKVLENENPLRLTFYVVLFAALSFTLLGQPARILHLGRADILYGGLLGVLSTAMAISFLFLAIDRIGSVYVSIFSTFELVWTVLAAAIFLGERIILFQLGGMLLIIAGIVLPNLIELRGGKKGAETR